MRGYAVHQRLSAPQQQCGDYGHLCGTKLQIAKFRVAETLLIFRDAIAKTAHRAQKMSLNQLSNCSCTSDSDRFITGSRFVLIAGCYDSINGEWVLFRRGHLFSNKQPITRASVAVNSYFIVFSINHGCI